MSSLTVRRPEDLHFSVSPVGLVADPEATFDDWKAFGKLLKNVEEARQWIIGDWINEGEKRWGEKYQQAMEETGYEYQTLRAYAYVCANVGLLIRNQQLTFAHHRVVAPLPPADQSYWLGLAAEKGWDDAELRKQISPKDPPSFPAYNTLKRKVRMFEQMSRDELKTEDADERRLMREMIDDHLQVVNSLRKDLEDTP